MDFDFTINLPVNDITDNNIKRKTMAKISAIYPKSMEFLKSKVTTFLREEIIRVYNINSFRKNVVPIQEFLDTISIKSQGWNFSIFLDEDKIKWKDKENKSIYTLNSKNENSSFKTSREEVADELEEYWQTPINGINEQDFFMIKTKEKIEEFIQKEFIPYITLQIKI